MTEREKTLRKAISYCIDFYDNKEATNRIMQFIKDDRALQLQQTGVIYQLCECGGNERGALDCVSKNCRHPKYNKK